MLFSRSIESYAISKKFTFFLTYFSKFSLFAHFLVKDMRQHKITNSLRSWYLPPNPTFLGVLIKVK